MADMDALVRGARIAYDDEGSGPLVVRLHGLTGSRAADDATGAFDAGPLIRAGKRVVRYDARGHGSSGGEKAESDYAWPNLALDLLALLDVLGAGGAVSGVGSSMGTATLLHAVALAPERFDRARAHLPADGLGEPRRAGRRVPRGRAVRRAQRQRGVRARDAGAAPPAGARRGTRRADGHRRGAAAVRHARGRVVGTCPHRSRSPRSAPRR